MSKHRGAALDELPAGKWHISRLITPQIDGETCKSVDNWILSSAIMRCVSVYCTLIDRSVFLRFRPVLSPLLHIFLKLQNFPEQPKN